MGKKNAQRRKRVKGFKRRKPGGKYRTVRVKSHLRRTGRQGK